MYCPKCGKENDGEQRFCRACGLGLRSISDALASELSTPGTTEMAIQSAPALQSNWRNPLLFGFFLLTLGLTIIILGKKVFGEQLVADIGTFLSVLGIGFLIYKGISLLRSQPATTSRPDILLEARPSFLKTKPTKELAPASPDAAPPSVTEHTTRHFEPVFNRGNKD
ncbi:MAG: hypothetical protein QOJ64_1266 [Acidobacteriota bacterium]|nr:hypothetical protein [Acidobacteriota bacterium]